MRELIQAIAVETERELRDLLIRLDKAEDKEQMEQIYLEACSYCRPQFGSIVDGLVDCVDPWSVKLYIDSACIEYSLQDEDRHQDMLRDEIKEFIETQLTDKESVEEQEPKYAVAYFDAHILRLRDRGLSERLIEDEAAKEFFHRWTHSRRSHMITMLDEVKKYLPVYWELMEDV